MDKECVELSERIYDIEKKILLLARENVEDQEHWTITRKLERKIEVMETNLLWTQKSIESKLEHMDKKLDERIDRESLKKRDKKIYLFYALIIGIVILVGQIIIKVI